MFTFAEKPQPITKNVKDAFKLFRITIGKIWAWMLLLTFSSLIISFFSNLTVIFFMIPIITHFFISALLLHRIYAIVKLPHSTMSTSFQFVITKWLPLLGVAFITLIAILLSVVLGVIIYSTITIVLPSNKDAMLITALILMIAWGYILIPLFFLLPIMLFEEQPFVKLLPRAFSITYNHWWQTSMILFVVSLFLLMGLILFGLLFSLFHGVLAFLITVLYLIALIVVVSPLIFSTILVQYNNIRISRSEKGL